MACKSLEPGAPFDWLLLCTACRTNIWIQYIISTIFDPYKQNILNPQTVLNISSPKAPKPNKEFPQTMIVVGPHKPKLLNPGTIYDPYKHKQNVWLFTSLDLQCACTCLLLYLSQIIMGASFHNTTYKLPSSSMLGLAHAFFSSEHSTQLCASRLGPSL